MLLQIRDSLEVLVYSEAFQCAKRGGLRDNGHIGQDAASMRLREVYEAGWADGLGWRKS